MSKSVLIVDYGVGNLLSVRRALEHCGAKTTLSRDSEDLFSASRVVLPGVGAFGDCVKALRTRGLDNAIRSYVASQKPLLGICVGMQMLFDSSEEFGWHEGLKIIPGVVRPIPGSDVLGRLLRIPHIGWSALEVPECGGEKLWSGSILKAIRPGTAAYFVHSFSCEPTDPNHRLAEVIYGGHRLVAAVQKGPVFGAQFHPEKSGRVGLEIIEEFLRY